MTFTAVPAVQDPDGSRERVDALLKLIRAALDANTNPDEYALVKLIGPVIRDVQHVVEKRMETLGSARLGRP